MCPPRRPMGAPQHRAPSAAHHPGARHSRRCVALGTHPGEAGAPAPTRPPALTLLEVVEAPELHQAVAIIVVGDIDAVVLGHRVLHPGPLVAPVAVVLRGGLHRLDGAFALHLLHWVPRKRRRRKAYPCPRQPFPAGAGKPFTRARATAGPAWPRVLGPLGRVPPSQPRRSPTPVWRFRAPGAVSPLPADGGGEAAGSGAGCRGGAGRSRGAGHGGLCPCDGLGWGTLSSGGRGAPLLLPLQRSRPPHRALCGEDEPAGRCVCGGNPQPSQPPRPLPHAGNSPRPPAGPSAAPACPAL